ncbi:MAG: phosphodiester glycosidase family protein [Deferribacteres bacterium]|nr:phosphodiester glycosidase family protein [candidate division KSB1 bacterium]MCB9503554.1 phosphodiester glycosidase family protein [Deferribacteres bacterium]
MLRKQVLVLLLLLPLVFFHCEKSDRYIDQIKDTAPDSLGFVQIKTDTLFESKQIISVLTLSKEAGARFKIEFAYNNSISKPTSNFAQNANALAAINGGFFNMDSGGNVTYFEVQDSVVSRRRNPELKWGIEDSIMTGAIVVIGNFEISLEPVKAEKVYESSHAESAVLVTGPLLLRDSKRQKLPQMKFSNNRHPRTCLCESEETIAFITVDGRSEQAAGMSLPELQKFLLDIGCIDAINLDGGGSTTMWLRDKGVVNFPSDKTGERPVANALLILGR